MLSLIINNYMNKMIVNDCLHVIFQEVILWFALVFFLQTLSRVADLDQAFA